LAGLLAFACAAIALVLIAPGALATAGGGGNELEQVEGRLAKCKFDLAQARRAVNQAEDILALARKRPFVLTIARGLGVIPVSIEDATNVVILSYLTGEITQAQAVKRLANLATLATVTRNLVTGGQAPAIRDVTGTQRGTVSGSVKLDGTLPAGWNVYVSFSGGLVRAGQGEFTIKDPIGSQRGDNGTATICPKAPPPPPAFPLCEAARNGTITLGWFWGP